MEAALQLCGETGYASLSLRSVARKAGIAPTSFYRHFRDIDELGVAMVMQAKDVLLEYMDQLHRIATPFPSPSEEMPAEQDSFPEFFVPLFVRSFLETMADRPLLLGLFFQERTGSSKAMRTAVSEETDRLIGLLSELLKSHWEPPKSDGDDLRLLAETMLTIVSYGGMEMLIRPGIETKVITERVIQKIHLLFSGALVHAGTKQGGCHE